MVWNARLSRSQRSNRAILIGSSASSPETCSMISPPVRWSRKANRLFQNRSADCAMTSGVPRNWLVADQLRQMRTGHRPKRGAAISGMTPSHGPSMGATTARSTSAPSGAWLRAASMNQSCAKTLAAPASADRAAHCARSSAVRSTWRRMRTAGWSASDIGQAWLASGWKLPEAGRWLITARPCAPRGTRSSAIWRPWAISARRRWAGPIAAAAD